MKNKHVNSCAPNYLLQPARIAHPQSDSTATSVENFLHELVHVQKCHLFPDHPDIELKMTSDNWGAEATGIDLVHNEFLQSPGLNKSLRLQLAPLYICDTPKENHDKNVAAIAINNDHRIFHSTIVDCSTSEKFLQLLDSINEAYPNQPVVVNRSIGRFVEYWESDPTLIPSQYLENVFIVHSSGNEWDATEGLSRDVRINASHNYFVTGAIAENGLPANYSSEGGGVLVGAPSGDGIVSCPANRDHCSTYNGTSSAAPLVSYAFRAALSALPQLKKHHLRHMAEKTAIPVISSFERPRLNGAGMVNAYKLWHMAQHIAGLCRSKKGEAKEACVEEQVYNDANYQFNSLVDYDDLKENFPQCFGLAPPRDCKREKGALTALRIEAFLHPENRDLWRIQACLQKLEGFSDSATFYGNIGRDFRKEPFNFADFNISQLDIKALRASRYVEDGRNQLTRMSIDSGNFDTVNENLWRFNLSLYQVLRNQLASSNPEEREDATKFLHKLGPGAFPLLEKALQDPSPRVRSMAATTLRWTENHSRRSQLVDKYLPKLKGNALFNLVLGLNSDYKGDPSQHFEELLKSDDPSIKAAALLAMSQTPRPEYFAVATLALENEDTKVRENALLLAVRSEPSKSVDVLSKVLKDTDQPNSIRKVALIIATLELPRDIGVQVITEGTQLPSAELQLFALTRLRSWPPETSGTYFEAAKNSPHKKVRDLANKVLSSKAFQPEK